MGNWESVRCFCLLPSAFCPLYQLEVLLDADDVCPVQLGYFFQSIPQGTELKVAIVGVLAIAIVVVQQ